MLILPPPGGDGHRTPSDHKRGVMHDVQGGETVSPKGRQSALFDKRYQIADKLGQGPYSVLFKALHVEMNRQVVLKFLTAAAHDRNPRERFRREARFLSLLSHPNTMAIYDFRWENVARPFIVTEYIEGQTLTALIEQGPLSPGRVVRLTRQLLAGLEEVHARGLVHRDLKPDNIMITKDPNGDDLIKILDFGIASFIDGPPPGQPWQTITTPGQIVGTPRYMAPEQLVGEPASTASDLFSIGLIFFEMLTGRRAFAGESPDAIMAQQFDPAPVLNHDERDIHPMLIEIARLATCKDPEGRMTDCEEFLMYLQGVDPDQLDG